MKQLSARGLAKALARKLSDRARREQVSFNKATPAVVGDALDAFIGCWSDADEKRLLDSIASCEVVDEALSK